MLEVVRMNSMMASMASCCCWDMVKGIMVFGGFVDRERVWAVGGDEETFSFESN